MQNRSTTSFFSASLEDIADLTTRTGFYSFLSSFPMLLYKDSEEVKPFLFLSTVLCVAGYIGGSFISYSRQASRP